MRNERPRKQEGGLWIFIGVLLIAAALFLVVWNLYDGLRAERSAEAAVAELAVELSVPSEETAWEPVGTQEPSVRDQRTVIPDYVYSPQIEMPVSTIEGIDFVGILELPTLELTLPIISQWSYPNLKIAPCRYSGSAYLNDLVICGHNYTSHFGRLKELALDDPIVFLDMDGNVFSYYVTGKEIWRPMDTEETETGDWDLTLFTCTVGGQSRLAIRCELAEDGT